MVGFLLGYGQKKRKLPFLSWNPLLTLVRIRLEIEKNTLFGRAFVRIRSKIEKTPFLSGALVRIRLEIEKNTLLVGLWLGLRQK